MVINVNFYDRILEFESTGEHVFKGEGLDNLLAKVAKYGTMINRVEIKGQSRSFTFARQVYLFANVLSYISNSEVLICSKSAQNKMQFPSYDKIIFDRQ